MKICSEFKKKVFFRYMLGVMTLMIAYGTYSRNELDNFTQWVSILFLIVGLFLITRTYPYYRQLDTLQSEHPLEMRMEVNRTSNSSDAEYDVVLTPVKSTEIEKIEVYLGERQPKWIENWTQENTVKVYGVLNKHGPVVIKSINGVAYPGSDFCVRRYRGKKIKSQL